MSGKLRYKSSLGRDMELNSVSPLIKYLRSAGLISLSAALILLSFAVAAQAPWAWGDNRFGQLGDGTNTSSKEPVRVTTSTGLPQLIGLAGGGEHSLALAEDGSVWAWGNNDHGQLGNGCNAPSNLPALVLGLDRVTAIAAGGSHSLALKEDGTVWAWGGNWAGQLGDATTADSDHPVQVLTPSGLLAGVIEIAAGGSHSLALTDDGSVWAWGSNLEGQIGDGTFASSAFPVRVSTLAGVIAIEAGSDYSVALDSDGTLWTWGSDWSGQLSGGEMASSSTPRRVAVNSSATGRAGGGDRLMTLIADVAGGPAKQPVQIPGFKRVTLLARGDNHYLALAENCPSVTLAPPSLPNGSVASPYSQTITASGGTAPYTFAVTVGSLPPGLGLNSSTGVISGIPTMMGSFPFTIDATDASGADGTPGCSGSQPYTINIDCPTITLSPTSLPNGALVTPYSQTVAAVGGVAPYTYAVTSGLLPFGFSLNGSTGAISGTPLAPGSFPFTITATDARGCSGSQPYTVVIGCPTISLLPASLPSGTLAVPYSQTFSAGGGTAPYTFAVTAGSLPPGLTLNTSTGLLSGTPLAPGSFTFTVTATDAFNCTGSQPYTVAIACPAIALSPASLPGGSVSVAYSQTISASGGAAPYSFVVTAGSLPPGLSLNGSTGVLLGTPTATGSFTFTVKATDANGCFGTKQFTICTFPPAWTPTTSMAAARQGHTATLLSSGKVLVVGGNGSSNPASALATCALYNPSSGSWSSTGAMVTPRGNHKSALLNSGKVLVAGGLDATGSPLASAQLYDPVAGTWSATGPMASVRYYHTITLLPSGKVLVAGGSSGSGGLATAQLYDPVAGTWSATGSMAAGRYNHTATLLPNGKVLVTGGASSTSLAMSSVQIYDPVAGSWSAASSMIFARSGHTATLLPSGKVLVAGGLGISGLVASSEIYDPTLGTWSPTGSMVTARFYHSETLLLSGRVLVAGGSGGSGFLASSELYDPAAGTWSPSGSMSTTREFHTATRLPSGKVLVAGGWKGSLGLTGAELFDPSPCCATTITLWPASLPASTLSISYSQRISAEGDAEPYEFEILEGSLPEGLALDGETGMLEGTPFAEGIFNFTVVAKAISSGGCSGSQSYSLSVANPIATISFFAVTTTSVSLSWPAVSGAESYDVWRAAGSSCSGAAKVTAGPITDTIFDDSGLECGGTFSYFITINDVGGTSFSGGCGTVTLSSCSPPGEVASGTSPSEAQVWTDKDTQTWPAVPWAEGYTLYRGTQAGLPSLLSGAADSCTKYTGASAVAGVADDPSTLPPGDFYWYLVTASNAYGEGSAGSATAGERILINSGVCP